MSHAGAPHEEDRHALHAGDAHETHADGHPAEHEEGEPLGPLDAAAWGAGSLGVGIGVVMAICFALATSGAAG